jgi:hypothetical protein
MHPIQVATLCVHGMPATTTKENNDKRIGRWGRWSPAVITTAPRYLNELGGATILAYV